MEAVDSLWWLGGGRWNFKCDQSPLFRPGPDADCPRPLVSSLSHGARPVSPIGKVISPQPCRCGSPTLLKSLRLQEQPRSLSRFSRPGSASAAAYAGVVEPGDGLPLHQDPSARGSSGPSRFTVSREIGWLPGSDRPQRSTGISIGSRVPGLGLRIGNGMGGH